MHSGAARPSFRDAIAGLPRRTPEEQAEFKRREQESELEREQRARKDRLGISGVSTHIATQDANAVIANKLDRTLMLEAVERWLGQEERSVLMLMGPVGRGKTLCSANAIADNGGVFITAHRVLRLFASRYGRKVFEEQDRILEAGMLVIDDVGREHDKDAPLMCSTLLELVDARQAHRRTIITSNLMVAAFGARYHEPRLHSRLHHIARVFENDGPDLRRAKT